MTAHTDINHSDGQGSSNPSHIPGNNPIEAVGGDSDQISTSPFSDTFEFEESVDYTLAKNHEQNNLQQTGSGSKLSILKRTGMQGQTMKGGQTLTFTPSTPSREAFTSPTMGTPTSTDNMRTRYGNDTVISYAGEELETKNVAIEEQHLSQARNPDDARYQQSRVLRWGTLRHKRGGGGGGGGGGGNKIGRGMSLRWVRKVSDNRNESRPGPIDKASQKAGKHYGAPRSVYFNMSLPPELVDNHGKPVTSFSRNKVRTTKYTPLSFIPKNLYFQFKNIANIYFAAMVVLGFFSVFGVANPAMTATPLVAIVIITAIKDAVEDSRRTILDLEVNNNRTHVLLGVKNPNVSLENISLWRKFKKLNTRVVFACIRFYKETFTKAGRRRRAQRRREEHMASSKLRGHGPRMSLDSIGSYGPSLKADNGESVSADQNCMLNVSVPPIPDCKFGRVHWKDISVGDIVRIHNNDQIPADVLLLSTSDMDGGCYVETKDLDGETNLKVRQSLKCSHMIRNSRDVSRCKFWVDSEPPQPNLYTYQGNLKWVDIDGAIYNETVNINNILLRGCILRNTKWAIGIVLFTGKDTKIMLNAGITPTKKSRISRELNYSVLLQFGLLLILCVTAAVLNSIYYRSTDNSRSFFEFGSVGGNPISDGIIAFFVAPTLYQSLVPISLYISIEIIKTIQAFFIYSDVLIYNERLDYPCTPKSWNISDDLGQVEYIFSDKTGTLTQNVMEFKKCTINGVSYGRAYTEALAGLRKRQGIDVEEEMAREQAEIAEDRQTMINTLKQLGDNSQFFPEEITFVSKELAQDLSGASGDAQKDADTHFLLALALCHSVVVEKDEKNPDKLNFKAQSPDESALVAAARDMGFSFVERTKSGVVVEVQGVQKEFQTLNVLEFNSARKRMSCIIKMPPAEPNGKPKALLICKGADSVIYSRLDRSNNDTKLLERTALHLEHFATEGLRTLCVAQKELTWEEYEAWDARYMEAAAALVDREDKIEEVADSIERNLILLGGTAIEDRLQDGVPASIEILAQAGIKLWVLTGDKVETAINIGFSCNLLTNDMVLLVIRSSGEDVKHLGNTEKEVVTQLIEKYLSERFSLTGSVEELQKAKKEHKPPEGEFGVVIDGDALKVALSTEELSRKFLMLCKNCKVVLCCRVSPAQKAAVVKLVKDSLDVMTLAVGDGSNDVAMIQAADVGVGISGEEGRQAVMSSDYAIGQFRYLTRLVLVHGRWSYIRLAEMIPQFFHKNIVFTIAHFWFGIFNNYDGSYLYEYTFLIFYNLAFTSLPVILLGVLDQDVKDVVSIVVPQLYRMGILRTEWTQKKFWWYCIDALYKSAVCFFLPYLVFYRTGLVTNNGRAIDHRYWFGTFVTCISVICCNLYVIMHQYRWDWISIIANILSSFFAIGWCAIWSSFISSGEFYNSALHLFGQPTFWTVIILSVIVSLLPKFTYQAFQKLFFPTDIDIIRECWARGDFSNYPEDYDPTDPARPRINKPTSDSFSSKDEKATDSRLDSDVEIARRPLVVEDIPMSNMHKDTSPPYASRASRDTNRLSRFSSQAVYTRSSLDRTREEMLQSRQLDSRYSLERARTSLELPGITRAATLISSQ